MHKVVLINGAPGSGKDSLSDHLAAAMPCVQMKFAATIRRALYAHYEMTSDEIAYYEGEGKNKQDALFNGRSWREEMIAYSEEYVKPRHGVRHFGLLAARSVRRNHNLLAARLLVFSDAGFTPEEHAFIDTYWQDARYLVIRLFRPGTKWDSRHSLNSDDFIQYGDRVVFTDLWNDSTLPEFLSEGLMRVRDWMNIIG